MKARVKKWGNSLALRIPKSFATEAGLSEESAVDVTLTDGKLVITPSKRSKMTLAQLVARINDNNLHGEFKTGPAAGREAW